MQLGNFAPNPYAQAIGKVGNVAGGLIDAYQAYDALSEEDYVSAAINAASLALPFGLGSQTFRRNSKYLQPGQPLYPFSPQANLPANATYSQIYNAPRVNYIEPFTKVRGMTDANLLANRALLGTLGAETVYDTELIPQYQMGGSIPGSVGFTYARTNSPAPSNGKYAKKTMASAQNGTVKESTSVNRDRRIPSVKDVIKKIPGTKVYKDVYGNLLEKDDDGVYKPRQKEKEEVRKHVPQSKLSKAKEIALNPMTAAGYKVRNEDIPDNFSSGERNNLDTAVDFINPVYYAESAKNLAESQGQVFSDLSEGNFGDAALNQTMAGVEALNFIPIAKGAKPFVQKGMKQLGNVKTSISPELRQGLQTNGIFSSEYLEGLKRTATKKLFDSRSANTEENLKRLKLLTSPETLKAIGNVDAPIADNMLYNFMVRKNYPSVKEFRTEVKKATLEANRIKKLNPEFDFSPDIFKHPDLVNHANDYLLSEPKYLSTFVNAKEAAEKTIANKQNVKSFLEKEYVKKMDLINQDSILKNIAEESPQYVDDIYNHLKNPIKSTDEFVNDLIKQSNTFTRSMHKSMKSGNISKEDFFTPQGSSMGFSNKNTIDVEGFPTSDIRGEYGNNKYKIFPNEERMTDIANTPLEERWAKRFPNTFAGNENIDFGLGVHANVENDFLHKAMTQRRIRNNMLVNRGSASIQPKIITSEIIPNKYLYQPKHVVFNTPEADQLVKGFDVEQVSDAWDKFKPEGPFGLHPGYTKGFKQGGVIKDDRGQWAHPGEITEIDSPYITMQGVPYPVLGISDEGDTQMMYPEEEYKFKGKKVTEFPMAKNGIRQEQKGLVNLDQLTNFTNYNTKQPGGWMDKYQ
jgi:hypothetical protein